MTDELEQQSNGSDQVESADGEVLVTVSPDRMEAVMTLTHPKGDGLKVTLENALRALKKLHVTHGVNYEKIEKYVDQKIYGMQFICAIGEKPVDGEDGSVNYHFRAGEEKKPIITNEGTVDFKNLDLIENVRSGAVLAEQVLQTDGKPGINVQGQPVMQKPGKPAQFKPGKFAEFSKDNMKIKATADGQVILRDGKIMVSPIYQVPANVDNTTGNIRFNGKVVVKGNVKSGFIIEADGNIEVMGVVEGAILKSNADIILNRGIQGNNQAELLCKGDLIAKYIENTKINVGGNVEAECILHSIVYAKKKIIIKGRKGLIVGGIVKAGEEIDAQIIGSSMGTKTHIEVGIDPDLKEKYDQAQEKLKDTIKNLQNLKQTIEILNKMNKRGPLPPSKKDMLIRSVKTYEIMKDQQIHCQEEIQSMSHVMENATKGKVHVSKTINPGVRITIHNAVKHVYDDLAMCTLYYKEGDIAIGLYEK